MLDSERDCGEHRYESQWHAYRERRNWLGVLIVVEFLAFFPFMALMKYALSLVFPTGNTAFLASFLMFAAVYLFTGSRIRTFPCPRCGENFFGGVFFATPRTVLGRKCANCGLRKYEGE